ncbi:MAG: helix-turn-helix domain-containing protein [Candidatus Sericytochromatia bacterium]|nr:helix-turn-helix domain-containing protein [Candidatus Sericytochromatia bacterium]
MKNQVIGQSTPTEGARALCDEPVAPHALRIEAPKDTPALQKRLLDQVLEGSGLEMMARTLAKELHCSVCVEDKQFNLLAIGQAHPAPEPWLDELIVNKGTPVNTIKRWESSGVLHTLRKERMPVTVAALPDSTVTRTVHPLVISGEVYGFFSVLNSENPPPFFQNHLESGAVVLSIELLKQKGTTESEQKVKRDFFRDLLTANTAAMMETLRRRATYLGYALNTGHWVITVEFDEQPHNEVQPEEVSRLVSILNALLSFRQAIVINQAQGATILYPVKEAQPSAEKVLQLTQAIQQKVRQTSAQWSVSVGVGRMNDALMDTPQSFKESLHALKIGRHTQGPGHVTFFSELGIYRMLLQFAQSQDPNEFFCEPLQRLIDYNQQTDKELVKTIAAFLECNGNLTETSTKLFIHRNTLKYRLERIRDITQIDLDDAENRLLLHLGLKMNQVVTYLR